MTKKRLREILQEEDKSRILVGQLSTLGREVRSTPMQWAYESKKLDATVKYLSWMPPWVERKSDDRDDHPLQPDGRCFLDKSKAVPDTVGLGRHPSQWWTMNCKYNAAYDVQRLNVASKLGNESVDESVPGDKQERFEFVRDSPDLVAQMLAVRTELLMRMVMPEVVKHSDEEPHMSMARFETGKTGNPHYHGFSVGRRGPIMRRVRDDEEGHEDLPPDTVSGDLDIFLEFLRQMKLCGDLVSSDRVLKFLV